MSERCNTLIFNDRCLHSLIGCKCECKEGFRVYMNPWSYLCRDCGHITKEGF